MKKQSFWLLIFVSVLVMSCKNDGFQDLEPESSELEQSGLKLLPESGAADSGPIFLWEASFSATRSACGDYYDCQVNVWKNGFDTKKFETIQYYLEDEHGRVIENLEYRKVNTHIKDFYKFKTNAIKEYGYYRVRLRIKYSITTDPFAYPSPYDLYTNKIELNKTNGVENAKLLYDIDNEDLLYKWDPVSGATSYKIYNSWDNGTTFNYYRTVTDLFYGRNDELKPKYFKDLQVKITAVTACGEGSAAVAAKIIQRPRNVREYYVEEDEEYTITWGRMSNIINYKLYASWDSGKTYKFYRTIPGSWTSFSRELKMKYYLTSRFKVSAVYKYGETESVLAPR